MKMIIKSSDDMMSLGVSLANIMKSGIVIELVGDVGAGKTTFTKGLAKGLGISEQVQSPSFTISRVYDGRDNLHLCHYDFYRLSDAGLMADELSEVVSDKSNIVVIEWSEAVGSILPADRIVMNIELSTETERVVALNGLGVNSKEIISRLN